jgi:hypothetical protein
MSEIIGWAGDFWGHAGIQVCASSGWKLTTTWDTFIAPAMAMYMGVDKDEYQSYVFRLRQQTQDEIRDMLESQPKWVDRYTELQRNFNEGLQDHMFNNQDLYMYDRRIYPGIYMKQADMLLANVDHFGSCAELTFGAINTEIATRAEWTLNDRLFFFSYSLHFYTDQFSAGHILTPRQALLSICSDGSSFGLEILKGVTAGASANAMHDEININGLPVSINTGDETKNVILYGDGSLFRNNQYITLSPIRSIIGEVIKYLVANYNGENIDINKVKGGYTSLINKLVAAMPQWNPKDPRNSDFPCPYYMTEGYLKAGRSKPDSPNTPVYVRDNFLPTELTPDEKKPWSINIFAHNPDYLEFNKDGKKKYCYYYDLTNLAEKCFLGRVKLTLSTEAVSLGHNYYEALPNAAKAALAVAMDKVDEDKRYLLKVNPVDIPDKLVPQGGMKFRRRSSSSVSEGLDKLYSKLFERDNECTDSNKVCISRGFREFRRTRGLTIKDVKLTNTTKRLNFISECKDKTICCDNHGSCTSTYDFLGLSITGETLSIINGTEFAQACNFKASESLVLPIANKNPSGYIKLLDKTNYAACCKDNCLLQKINVEDFKGLRTVSDVKKISESIMESMSQTFSSGSSSSKESNSVVSGGGSSSKGSGSIRGSSSSWFSSSKK